MELAGIQVPIRTDSLDAELPAHASPAPAVPPCYFSKAPVPSPTPSAPHTPQAHADPALPRTSPSQESTVVEPRFLAEPTPWTPSRLLDTQPQQQQQQQQQPASPWTRRTVRPSLASVWATTPPPAAAESIRTALLGLGYVPELADRVSRTAPDAYWASVLAFHELHTTGIGTEGSARVLPVDVHSRCPECQRQQEQVEARMSSQSPGAREGEQAAERLVPVAESAAGQGTLASVHMQTETLRALLEAPPARVRTLSTPNRPPAPFSAAEGADELPLVSGLSHSHGPGPALGHGNGNGNNNSNRRPSEAQSVCSNNGHGSGGSSISGSVNGSPSRSASRNGSYLSIGSLGRSASPSAAASTRALVQINKDRDRALAFQMLADQEGGLLRTTASASVAALVRSKSTRSIKSIKSVRKLPVPPLPVFTPKPKPKSLPMPTPPPAPRSLPPMVAQPVAVEQLSPSPSGRRKLELQSRYEAGAGTSSASSGNGSGTTSWVLSWGRKSGRKNAGL